MLAMDHLPATTATCEFPQASAVAMDAPSFGDYGFGDLSTRDLGECLAARFPATIQTYPAGQQIIAEGEKGPYCIWVIDGWAAASKMLPDGKAQIIDLGLPPDMIQATALDGRTYVYGLEALTDVRLCMLTWKDWRRLTQREPQFGALALILQSVTATRRAERMLRIGRGNSTTRIAYMLLELLVRLPCPEARRLNPKDPESIVLPMTQQQIGDFTGLSMVHVCRTMKAMARAGLIRTGRRGQIFLTDIRGLSAAAQIDLDELRRNIMPFARTS